MWILGVRLKIWTLNLGHSGIWENLGIKLKKKIGEPEMTTRLVQISHLTLKIFPFSLFFSRLLSLSPLFIKHGLSRFWSPTGQGGARAEVTDSEGPETLRPKVVKY